MNHLVLRKKLMKIADVLMIGDYLRVAKRNTRNFINIIKRYPPSWQTRGDSYVLEHDLEAAISCFQKALKEQPGDINILRKLANCQYSNTEYAAAISTYKSIADLSSDFIYGFVERYCAHIFLNNSKEAIKYLESICRAHPEFAKAHLLLGFEMEAKGDSDQALHYYQKALTIDLASSTFLSDVCYHFYIHGDIERCLLGWKRSIEITEQQSSGNCKLDNEIRILDSNPWTGAIGHFAIIDFYIKAGLLGLMPHKKIFLLDRGEGYVANRHLLSYFRTFLDIVDDRSEIAKLESLDKSLRQPMTMVRRIGGNLQFWPHAATEVQAQWEREKRPPLFSLTQADRDRGWDCLEKYGIPKGSWFVTLHVRESGFHGGGMSRDSRCADINTYVQAIETIVQRGGYVVRMGEATLRPFRKMKNFFDYAPSAAKSEWMDIFLVAQARFHLGTNSGLSVIPNIFGVPCAYTNVSPPAFISWFGNCLYLPKLLRAENGNLLPFEQMMAPPFAYLESLYYFKTHKLALIDNSPDEINDLVLEMFDLIEGKRSCSEQDIELQQRLQKLAVKCKASGRYTMGCQFLRSYADLLPED